VPDSSYLYRVELDKNAVLAEEWEGDEKVPGFFRMLLMKNATPPSISGENPAVLCRHPIQKVTPKQIRILRAYERAGKDRCVCSRRRSSPSMSPPMRDSFGGPPLLDGRRYDEIGTGRRDASEWGRRYFLDRQRIENQRAYYHKTANLLFYPDREDAWSIVKGFVPDPPGALDRLGLDEDATPGEVKTAFRQRSKEMHPDKGGDKEEFVELHEQYQKALEFVS